MNITFLREFFGWMTLINLGFLIFSAVMCLLLQSLIVRMHAKLFGLSPTEIKAALYGFLGVYKIVFIVFVFVPWLALLIIG